MWLLFNGTANKVEYKTNFSRRLKQFDGLTWLTPTALFYDTSTPLDPTTVCNRKI